IPESIRIPPDWFFDSLESYHNSPCLLVRQKITCCHRRAGGVKSRFRGVRAILEIWRATMRIFIRTICILIVLVMIQPSPEAKSEDNGFFVRAITEASSEFSVGGMSGGNILIKKIFRASHYFWSHLFLFHINSNSIDQITYGTDSPNRSSMDDYFVVWRSGGPFFKYDIANKVSQELVGVNDLYISDMDSGKVVFNSDYLTGDARQIILYDLYTDESEQITEELHQRGKPRINGNGVVWNSGLYYPETDWDIHYYDISSQVEHKITADTYDDEDPDVDEGRILWVKSYGDDSGTYGLFFYDVAQEEETEILVHDDFIRWESIDGQDIVWNQKEDGLYKLYHYDISSETVQLIPTASELYEPAALKNHRIVWAEQDGGVFFHDLNTGVTQQISDHDTCATAAYLDEDGNISWATCEGVAFLATTGCTDDDDDGFAIEGGKCGTIDCDDTDSTVHPWMAGQDCSNAPDGIDNDCDGEIDEDECGCFIGIAM
ncbi:hypothetical protein ACFL4G_10115, partial [Thermodesulfobacteriota bacterium]